MKRIVLLFAIEDLVKEYSDKTGSSIKSIIEDAIGEYLDMKAIITSKKHDKSLLEAMITFDREYSKLISLYEDSKKKYMKQRREEYILSDLDVPKFDNDNYYFVDIDESLYNRMRDRSRDLALAQLATKAVVFYISYNEKLFSSEVYGKYKIDKIMDLKRKSSIAYGEMEKKFSFKKIFKLKGE